MKKFDWGGFVLKAIMVLLIAWWAYGLSFWLSNPQAEPADYGWTIGNVALVLGVMVGAIAVTVFGFWFWATRRMDAVRRWFGQIICRHLSGGKVIDAWKAGDWDRTRTVYARRECPKCGAQYTRRDDRTDPDVRRFIYLEEYRGEVK